MASRTIGYSATVALAGFANPRYIDRDPTNALGFDISQAKAVAIAVVSMGTNTVVAEQTFDGSGAAGWFPVLGKRSDDAAGVLASAFAAAKGYVFPALGIRMRFRVTALATADLVAQLAMLSDTFDLFSTAQGAIAEDGAATSAGNPVPMGAEARSTQKSSMSGTGDIVRPQATIDGKLVVMGDAIPELSWSYAAAAGGIVSSTADVVLKAAAGAGIRNYLRSMMIDHDVLGAVTEFVLKDGATIIYRGKLQTPAQEGGGDYRFDPPLKTTANAALNFALLTSVTGGVFVNASGFTGP